MTTIVSRELGIPIQIVSAFTSYHTVVRYTSYHPIHIIFQTDSVMGSMFLFFAALAMGSTFGFVSPSGMSSPRTAISASGAAYLNLLSMPRVTVVVAATTASSQEAVVDVDAVGLLDAALKSNVTAASSLLAELNQLRSSSDSDATEKFLTNLLNEFDSKTPWWSRLPAMTRLSKRARRASLRRVLDLSTPSASETESLGSDEDADKRRRRRSFVIILRSLANLYDEEDGDEAGIKTTDAKKTSRIPAIVALEKAAKREAKANVQSGDMANRLPKGLETPKYDVLAERKQYEVRRYDPFSVCSVVMSKPRPVDTTKTDAQISNPQLSGASSFGALAGYLFGKNQQETAMKMTTPVLSRGDGDARQMSFVLPSDYWGGLETAPKPLEGSGVILERDEGGEQAVVMFGGFAGKKDVEERTKQLMDGLKKDKQWQVDPAASVNLAQYNDPFTPPWKRRNEVSIKVLPVEK
jgi:hypothetical protein